MKKYGEFQHYLDLSKMFCFNRRFTGNKQILKIREKESNGFINILIEIKSKKKRFATLFSQLDVENIKGGLKSFL